MKEWWTRLLSAFWEWWGARQRKLDLTILWPTLKRQSIARSPRGLSPETYLNLARRAFLMHILLDDAWRHARLWTKEELERFVRENLN
jgi:hypothetical protein